MLNNLKQKKMKTLEKMEIEKQIENLYLLNNRNGVFKEWLRKVLEVNVTIKIFGQKIVDYKFPPEKKGKSEVSA